MAKEEEYIFDDENKKQSKFSSFGKFLWNGDTKEFCGRDGASWGKVSLFYAVFYALLGGFFVGMIAVFVQIMPKDKPTYYGDSSVMATRGVNPGLGFRPQIDVEDSMVKYTPNVAEDPTFGYNKYVSNLNNFLNAKYPQNEGPLIFDHKKFFANTPCSSADPESKYGFQTDQACFLIKLNKIVGWKPESKNFTYVVIKCGGEFSADKDNVKSVTYHSESYINQKDEGRIPFKYFPFEAQKDYQAPFVWVQFEVNPNTLINIDCKAYADNIDNSDRMNRRGQTKFTLYVKNSSKKSG